MDDEWPGLSDWQWDAIKNAIPRPQKKPYFRAKRRGGRPRASDKKIFEAVLWTLRGEHYFERIPERFGRRRTVLRRLDQWLRSDTDILLRLWQFYLSELKGDELWSLHQRVDRNPIRHYWQGTMAAVLRIRALPFNPGS